MAIKKIGHYALTNPASIYDEESLTALELAGRTAGKVNESIEAFNKLEEDTLQRLRNQDIAIQIMNDETMPEKVRLEVLDHINKGDFDKAINLYLGNLELRLNNLLGSVKEGSTTLDAEVIDIRLDEEGITHDTAGNSVRMGMKQFQPNVAFYHRINYESSTKTITLSKSVSTGKINASIIHRGKYFGTKTITPVTDSFVIPSDDNRPYALVWNTESVDEPFRIQQIINDYVPREHDILLFLVYYDVVYPLAITVSSLTFNNEALFPMPNNNRKYCQQILFTRGGLIVDYVNKKVTIPKNTYTTSEYFDGGIRTITEDKELLFPENIGVFQYLLFHPITMDMEIVEYKNYIMSKDIFLLGCFYNNVFYPMEIVRDCVTFIYTNNAELVTTPTRTIADMLTPMFQATSNNKFKIVLGGDSITHGVGGSNLAYDGEQIGNTSFYRNPNGYCWSNLFKSFIEGNFQTIVTNNACKGTHSAWWVNQVSDLVPSDTNLFILMLGTNDRAYGENGIESVTNYYNNMCKIVDYCKERNIDILLVTPIPASVENESSDTMKSHVFQINRKLQAVAKQYHIEYVNLYNELYYYFKDHNLNYDSYLPDGLHPGDELYNIMFYRMLKLLDLSPSYINVL